MSVRRKYLLEAALHLYSGGPAVMRPFELYRYHDDPRVRQALDLCNIYLIVRRKKIVVCPQALRVSEGLVSGDLLVHDGLDRERVPFAQRRPWDGPGGPLHALRVQVRDDNGHEIVVDAVDGARVVIPAHAVVAETEHQLEAHTDLHVLYIGQGIGRSIERLAIDRLRAHTTFQRVLCDTLHEAPDCEILLLLFRYEHHRVQASTGGDFSVEPSASDQQERDHLDRLTKIVISRRNRIALAEAALIHHFKPRYNYLLKEAFPPPKAKLVRELCSQDLSGLIVEISTSSIGSRLRTDHRPPRRLTDFFEPSQIERLKAGDELSDEGRQFVQDMTHTHVAQIPLFSAEDRESFLHALPWAQAPVLPR